MLGTLLDKLESLFSKNFVVASIPLLVFLFMHGLMAYRAFYNVQQWVNRYFLLDTAHVAVLSVALLLVVVVVSYVLSTLGEPLREILEGKHLFPQWLSNALGQRYRNRLRDIEKKLEEAKHNRRTLRNGYIGWRDQMGIAYQIGHGLHDCNYVRSDTLTRLLDRRLSNQNVNPGEIQAEVDSMTNALKNNSPELNTPASEELDLDHSALLSLILYAADNWEAQVVKYFNEVQLQFAGKNIAPTKMGNISNVAPYYAASRYGINLDIFWTRLQKVLQSDTNFYPLIQQAKRQLDFLVSLFWQTLVFTLLWVVLLPWLTDAKLLFVLIAIAGPVLTWIWYKIAVQNYLALSDLLRAAIDLYRLDLLRTLHLPLPANAEQERALWQVLEQRLGYADRSNVVLQHP